MSFGPDFKGSVGFDDPLPRETSALEMMIHAFNIPGSQGVGVAMHILDDLPVSKASKEFSSPEHLEALFAEDPRSSLFAVLFARVGEDNSVTLKLPIGQKAIEVTLAPTIGKKSAGEDATYHTPLAVTGEEVSSPSSLPFTLLERLGITPEAIAIYSKMLETILQMHNPERTVQNC